jgi:hypothetical protein
MAAAFEIGDQDRPRGHALLYFRVSGTADEVVATYVVVLPIAINPAKYIPPAFAARMPQPVSEVAATALPPIPETMESAEQVRQLARRRDDDLLDGGVIDADPERLMVAAHEVAQQYAAQYQRALETQPIQAAPPPEPPDEDALRWMLMSEKERIGELAKLTGQLRYAIDGGDEHLRRATVAQVEKLARLLPEKYRIADFLAAAQRPGDNGRRLAELYIDRCYKLGNEQYEALPDLDRQIQALES